MKKFTLGLMTAFMLFLFSPVQVKADTEPIRISTAETSATTNKTTETNVMIDRMNEIKAMDISTLNSSEKKELRNELRSIKSELKANGESTYIEGRNGGVYISVGAAIIIVLLLVLIL